MVNNNAKIGVSIKAIILNKQGELLAIRRTETAPSRPLHWDLPGGQLDYGEDVREGIAREVQEETGLEIKNLKLFDVISKINEFNEFWVTICYEVQASTKEVRLSFEHDDYQWVTPEDFLKLKASARNKEFVERLSRLKWD